MTYCPTPPPPVKKQPAKKQQESTKVPSLLIILIITFAVYKLGGIQITPATAGQVSSITTAKNTQIELPIQVEENNNQVKPFAEMVQPRIVKIDNSNFARSEDQPGDCSIDSKWPSNIQKWCGWITENARLQRVDADFIATLVSVESQGNANSVSSACATGLIQVMPRDGRFDGPNKWNTCDLKNGTVENYQQRYSYMFDQRPTMQQLIDPQYNLYAGSQIFGDYYRSCNGDLRCAFTRYNGSSENAQIYLNRYVQFTGKTLE